MGDDLTHSVPSSLLLCVDLFWPQDRGIPAVHIDGSTPKAERNRAYAEFGEGSTLLLSNVNVLSEGFDEPRIGALLMLRPTTSRALYIQQMGRGLRCAPGKTHCVVIDQARNTW